MDFTIEAMRPADWDAVREIYRAGIATGHATFETEPPDWALWDRNHLPTCRFVARADGRVIGWGALSVVSGRCVYAGVAEVSVYVDAAARAKGVGKALLCTLIAASEGEGLWTLQAGVFPENAASIALHKGCGFREVGRRERIGALRGVWRDVILLERRSAVVGIE